MNFALNNSFNQRAIAQQSRNQVLVVVLALIAFALLQVGYLGINLFDYESTTLLIIRVSVVVVVSLLFLLELKHIKIHRTVLLIFAVAAVGALTSSILLNIMFMCFFAIATRSLPISTLLITAATVLLIAIVATLLMIQLGIIFSDEEIVGLVAELGGELRARMSLGYRNVNSFASIVSAFCLLLVLSGRQTIIRCCIALALSYVVYEQTDSRSMMAATVIFISYLIALHVFSKYRKYSLILSVCVILSTVVISLLPNVVMSQFPLLDFHLSSRLSFISAYYAEIPTFRLLIGGIDPPIGITVDNSFALIVGAIGLPMYLYLVIRVISIIRHCTLTRNHKLHAFILSFWLYSFAESSMVRPEAIIGIIFWIILIRYGAIQSEEKYVGKTLKVSA